jgi:hypothetical protein
MTECSIGPSLCVWGGRLLLASNCRIRRTGIASVSDIKFVFDYLRDMGTTATKFKARRPGEFVAFFTMEIQTGEGPGFVFFACDAFSKFAYTMGVEPNENPENILKHIYLLTEDPNFVLHRDQGFTLVLDRYEELSERIEGIIKAVHGRVLYDKKFHREIIKPLLEGLKEFGPKRR